MAGATLGKRHRAAESSLDANVTRAKRRAIEQAENDENANPLGPLRDASTVASDDCMDLDKLSPPKHANTSPPSRPHSKSKSTRSPLSPSKSNSNYNSVQTISTDSTINKPKQPSTPHTPRHRDALSKHNPITPRHRVVVPGKPLTPRQTPSTPSARTKSVYNAARTVFTRNADLGMLVGRETQRQELQNFIQGNVKSNTGGCLYVSGPPGTGKTALVTESCKTAKEQSNVRFGFVNCMSVKTASDVYTLLTAELGITDDMFEGSVQEHLRRSFTEGEGIASYLVVLDEIDQLLNLDLNVLYSLFEWSLCESSKLCLVGISNALDLTDRFLPRLKSRSLKPKLLPFLPYTAPEIQSVVASRARSLLPDKSTAATDFTPFLHPSAIQLISKKVSAQSGDIRKAFDIAQRAIDLVELETRQKLEQQNDVPRSSPGRTPLGENPNLSSPTTESPSSSKGSQDQSPAHKPTMKQYTVESAPRAMLSHIVKVTAATFGNGTSQRLKTLNLQQKAILCALVALERNNKANLTMPSTPSKRKQTNNIFVTPTKLHPAAPTMRTLYDTYSNLCKRENMLHGLSNTEFRDVIGSLETSSLVVPVDGKRGSFVMPSPVTPSKKGRGGGFTSVCIEDKRLSACVSTEDLDGAVEGVGAGILKSMLHGEIDV